MAKTNTVNFDIDATPPTGEHLADEARRIEQRLRVSRRQFVSVCALVGLLFALPFVMHTMSGVYAVGAVIGLALCSLSRRPTDLIGPALFVVMTLIAAWIWSLLAPSDRDPVGIPAMMLGTLFVFATYFAFDRLSFRKGELLAQLEALEVIEPSECPQVLEWCLAHAPLGRYQSAAVAQGRFLVVGEVEAMRRWVDTIDQRAQQAARDQAQARACERLKSPLLAA